MTAFACAMRSRYSRRVIASIALLALAACGGGGTSNEQPALNFSVASAESNVVIKSGAALYGLSKITVSNAGSEAADINVSFNTAQEDAQLLVPDLANPDQFWLPIVVAPTAGTLAISVPDRAAVSMTVTLRPFLAPNAPGLATRDFLETSLLNMNTALKELTASRPLPDLLGALTSTVGLAQQELTWVSNAMKNGTAVMAMRKDGTPVIMTTEDLRALDQMVLHTEALRTNQTTVSPAARLSPWMKIMNFLVLSAFAQTSDSAAFISATKATGDALGLTAYLVPGVAPAGPSAFRRSADAQVISLNMAGLYAAHYGNALATIETLPDLTFAKPMDEVQIAVSALFAGIINEIILPDLEKLSLDSAVALVRQFIAKADNAAVENIVMDNVIIFKARSVGISLCQVGERPVADPDVPFVSCASL